VGFRQAPRTRISSQTDRPDASKGPGPDREPSSQRVSHPRLVSRIGLSAIVRKPPHEVRTRSVIRRDAGLTVWPCLTSRLKNKSDAASTGGPRAPDSHRKVELKRLISELELARYEAELKRDNQRP